MPEPILGIDLGTTYSAIATINVAGGAELIENIDGHKSTASAVLFEPDNVTIIGQSAIDDCDPDHLERWFKREMGDPNFSVEHFGSTYSAVDLSGMVLKKVISDASVRCGPIRKAVITVPAYFEEIPRKATMDAAALAGIEVLALINEPTAAALAYAQKANITGRCLIYDFGGGTFDTSVVDITSPTSINVLTSRGDNNLGGFNLDEDLAALIDSQFVTTYNVSALNEKKSRHLLFERAQNIKRRLSSRSQINNELINNSMGQSISFSITRGHFEQIIQPRIRQTEMLVDNALFKLGLKPADIDHVLLVGGSTRIPAVQKMLERKFSKPPIRSLNPDEAVAMGAAIKAAQLLAQFDDIAVTAEVRQQFANAQFTDVTNSSYGTFAVMAEFGTSQLRNSIILERNTPLPCERTESYFTQSDNQTAVDISITQGEDKDPRFVSVIFEGQMELPPGRPAGQEIRITYRYDENQRMFAHVIDVTSGIEKNVSLEIGGGSNTVPSIEASIFNDLVIE